MMAADSLHVAVHLVVPSGVPIPWLSSCRRACRASRLAFDAARCRVLLSCLPPLPLADAPGSGGPAAVLPQSRRSTFAFSMRWCGSTACRWLPFGPPTGWAARCHPGRSAGSFGLANCSFSV